MKKFLRAFVPIVLVLAIIACLGWYLFIYDRELTRDILLQGARHFDSRREHETAAWFYNMAYRQAGDNDAVAIELAEQHKSTGNYTKAEYTLTNAIADGGGAELYIALCKTYIEQDKILDAIKLLDTVCRNDSNVNAQVANILREKRPATPTATPDAGFYNQYISVTITAESGTLYVNANGEYPSVTSDLYVKPISMVAGENSIYAVAVSEEGLPSTLAIFGYTIGGVIEEIAFADPAIETAVYTLLGVDAETPLYSNDLWDIKEFTVPADATDLSDLKHLPYLEVLNMDSAPEGQLGNLSALSHLRSLSVKNTPVTTEEVSVIGALPALESLTLSSCGITNISGLANCKSLTYLDLSDNTIRNISALASMAMLSEVYLQHNVVADLSPLTGANTLTTLDISYNALSNLSPLYGITELSWLNASNNTIADLSGIGQLANLKYLSVNYNRVTDISALSGCSYLTQLHASNNALTDLSALSNLNNLIHLDFSYNQVTTLPAWTTASKLITIDGSHNLLESLAPLSGLSALNKVYMDYNEAITSVQELENCPVLVLVNVYGTKVTDVTMLTDQSIVVNYNPTQETLN